VLAIQKVLADYSHAVDSGDGDALASLFVEDCTLDVGMEQPITSHDGIRQIAESVKAHMPGLRHYVSTMSVDGDGDSATGRAYIQVFNTTGGAAEAEMTVTGVVHATFRKEGGVRRHVTRSVARDS
jgi:uncharacterized protein (TIGR02246 family)